MPDLRRFDLSQRVAIVTGGNGGIGLGMVRALAAAGARVVVAARNAAKSEAAVGELRALGGEPLAITADVSAQRPVDALIAEAGGSVPGGKGGMGLGMGRALAAGGAGVVVAARNAAKSEAAVGELRALGGEPLAITADVSDERSVDALIAEAVGRCGRLDI